MFDYDNISIEIPHLVDILEIFGDFFIKIKINFIFEVPNDILAALLGI